jgi:chaperonin GroEL
MPARTAPGVIFQPAARNRLGRGIAQLVALIAPTLGPAARPVAIDREAMTPEFLDDGATIARRLLELPERSEDVGAMFLRNLLWRVHEQAGDGTATACVMFDAAFREGVRYLATGGNAMRLRVALQEGQRNVVEHLDHLATHASNTRQIRQFAQSVCHDPCIASMIADAYATLGQHALVEVRNDRLGDSGVRYIPGSFWKTQVHSHRFLTDAISRRFDLERAAILASDLDLDDPTALRSVVDKARDTGAGGLLMVSNRISDDCLTMLLSYRATTGFGTIAVRTPFAAKSEQMIWLREIELLTGGRALHEVGGEGIANVCAQDFGSARRAWADTAPPICAHTSGICGELTTPVPTSIREPR